MSLLLGRIIREGGIPEDQFDFELADMEALGLAIEDGRVGLSGDVELLDERAIRGALSAPAAAWLRELAVFLAVDSTNSRMAAAAQSASVDGRVWFAELQTAGRGRRGRCWKTPFARSIAVTLGFSLNLPIAELGGLSLAVGLTVAELLQREGASNAVVKWPNDICIGDAKICGILIDAVARAQACDCIVGIGLNLDLPASIRAGIEQKVTDLKAQGIATRRNFIAAALVSKVVEIVQAFEREGFAGMRRAYDNLHLCHRRQVRIVQGDRSRTGLVLGVTSAGALRIRLADGVAEFTGGEISLRRADGGRAAPVEAGGAS